jgi:hypothetical protein
MSQGTFPRLDHYYSYYNNNHNNDNVADANNSWTHYNVHIVHNIRRNAAVRNSISDSIHNVS